MTTITREEIEGLRDDLVGALTIRASLVRPLVEHALSEQSRIDEAVAKERERCASRVAEYAAGVRRLAGEAALSGPFLVQTADAVDRLAMKLRSPTP